LQRLADRIAAAKLPLSTELWFYAEVFPDALTPDAAAQFASTWVPRVQDADPREKATATVLALLDARSPEATLAMLRGWSKAAGKETKPRVMGLLAAVGGAAMLDGMCAGWREGRDDRRFLGRVADPKVEAFLRERSASADLEEQAAAVEALAIRYGCPEALAGIFGPLLRRVKETDPATW